jgi:hypothetical protein
MNEAQQYAGREQDQYDHYDPHQDQQGRDDLFKEGRISGYM